MLSFIEAVEAHPDLELHALAVLRDGEPIVKQSWLPYDGRDRALVYSASKTLTATAIGLAIGEGHFALDDPVAALLPDAVPASIDPVVAAITVHHLLSMSTGHDEDTLPAALIGARPQDWARRVLAIRPQTPVGSRHVYNNGASFLLGEILRRRTGTDVLEWLAPRVLEPLGIDATWDRDALGRCLGWSGAHLGVTALARFGELYRCDGVWQGSRLLPEGWVARATTAQIGTGHEEPADWRHGYGYQLWLGREGYRLDGAYGQFSLVLPERRLVVAIQSAQSATQVLLDLVWDLLLPELAATAVPPITSLALAVPPDAGVGSRWRCDGLVRLDPTLVVAGEEQLNLPAVRDPRAELDGARYRIGFGCDGDLVQVVATPGSWTRQEVVLGGAPVPVAVAAGTAADESLLVLITFTETPHTLRLRLGADGSAGLAWRVSPLQGAELASLRAC